MSAVVVRIDRSLSRIRIVMDEEVPPHVCVLGGAGMKRGNVVVRRSADRRPPRGQARNSRLRLVAPRRSRRQLPSRRRRSRRRRRRSASRLPHGGASRRGPGSRTRGPADTRHAGSASAALRTSRRFTLERLQEFDERALLVVAQAGFFGEIARTEVVPLVDDEVLALADREQVVDQRRKDEAQILSLLSPPRSRAGRSDKSRCW